MSLPLRLASDLLRLALRLGALVAHGFLGGLCGLLCCIPPYQNLIMMISITTQWR
jgi:hypothetical protein